MSNEIPEGYEPAENAAANDIVMDALEKALAAQDRDPYGEDSPIELIGLSDAVVEALLKAGVAIPEGLQSPFTTPLTQKES
ncbi:hypothetical protein [Citricoccus sp. K5]|uniref:hypothetical protein n=1 Tax=Citricoccus sp. K5 TaxID=2653135 RepID=UPI0012EF5AFF|nr:hypothetical protein [Citricoccus sp. K5]VXA92374.1 hypothetical protein CITRIK5_100018 [Citricoccus sp. K5]VXA94528.1 hypothetical protein CITRIK5_100084 [Citricoccus sp. K5]